GQAVPTTFESASRLRADVSAALLAQAGTASITVATPSPGGGTSAAVSFAVLIPRPAISAITPDTVLPGVPFALTVLGSHFVPSSQVNWNGVARSTNFVNASTLRVDVPA